MTNSIDKLAEQRERFQDKLFPPEKELTRIHEEIMEFAKNPLPPAAPKNAWDFLCDWTEWFFIVLLIALCAGTPDLLDAIMQWIQKH